MPLGPRASSMPTAPLPDLQGFPRERQTPAVGWLERKCSSCARSAQGHGQGLQKFWEWTVCTVTSMLMCGCCSSLRSSGPVYLFILEVPEFRDSLHGSCWPLPWPVSHLSWCFNGWNLLRLNWFWLQQLPSLHSEHLMQRSRTHPYVKLGLCYWF